MKTKFFLLLLTLLCSSSFIYGQRTGVRILEKDISDSLIKGIQLYTDLQPKHNKKTTFFVLIENRSTTTVYTFVDDKKVTNKQIARLTVDSQIKIRLIDRTEFPIIDNSDFKKALGLKATKRSIYLPGIVVETTTVKNVLSVSKPIVRP